MRLPGFSAETSLYRTSVPYCLTNALNRANGVTLQQLLVPPPSPRSCDPHCYWDTQLGACVKNCQYCPVGRPASYCYDQPEPCGPGDVPCPPLPPPPRPVFCNARFSHRCGNTCCPLENACCNGTCTDLTADPQNCGLCGNVCGGGQGCCNGTCKDLTADPQNCGACGNACPIGTECINGKCCQNPCPTLLGAECCDTGQVCNPGIGCVTPPPPPLGPVLINYHQVGACTGFTTPSGVVSTGSNQAYVVFEIESIDNSQSSSNFTFDPTRLFIQANNFLGPGTWEFYTYILGSLAVRQPIPVPGPGKINLDKFGVLIVQTSNPDGAAEANQTSYFLNYKPQAGDPPVLPVKSNASQSSWPDTGNCCGIQLPIKPTVC